MWRKSSWYWGLLPLNAVAGGLSTFIPLFIVDTGGSVIDVALTLSAYNFSLIPGFLLWGYITDRFHCRKPVLEGTCGGMAVCLVLMFFSPPAGLPLLYGVYGFLFAGVAPSSQLLIMETFQKRQWNDMVARTNAISAIGTIVGIVPGIVWTFYFSLKTYSIYLLALGVVTSIFFNRYLTEPEMTFERNMVTHFPESLTSRIREIPILFLKIPHISEWFRFFRMLRYESTKDIPVLLFSMFFFFTSTSLFFTPFTPYLKLNNISNSAVFLYSFVTSCTSVVGWVYSSKYAVRHGEKRAAMLSMLGRALSMTGMGVVALLVSGLNVLFGALILVSIITTCFSLANTPISTMLYNSIDSPRRGEYLGLYSALTSIGVLIGSTFSGYLSLKFGYSITFVVASALLLTGAALLSQFRNTNSFQAES
ncbi:MAG: MFS transporter [Candidatus Bathyarchaeia archaeon]